MFVRFRCRRNYAAGMSCISEEPAGQLTFVPGPRVLIEFEPSASCFVARPADCHGWHESVGVGSSEETAIMELARVLRSQRVRADNALTPEAQLRRATERLSEQDLVAFLTRSAVPAALSDEHGLLVS